MSKKHLAKMEFVKDEAGQELLLKDGKFQVMMEWEKPYMEACIDALRPSGDVLEVGFGCGYSATHIQRHSPKSHTIIEYHPVVAAKAREWAKAYPNVTIVEDTWQHALSQLGMYDEIFFDDYPLESDAEMKKMEKEKTHAHSVLQTGQKKMREVEEKLSFLKDVRYKDADLEAFFLHMQKGESVEPIVFLRFFFDLEEKGNITAKQQDKILKRLVREKRVTEEDIARYRKEREEAKAKSSAFTLAKIRGDRLFEFLDACLKKHMRKGARFSCYLNDPTSKFEDEKFFNMIITNPDLDYTEKTIPILVPPTCDYYKADSALVITVTKAI